MEYINGANKLTLENRQALAEALFEDCLQLLRDKGKAYSGDKDALANFKINAERMGLSKYQIWAVYFNKHIDSINNAVKDNPDKPADKTEGLSGRIVDAINYLIILKALLTEDNAEDIDAQLF